MPTEVGGQLRTVAPQRSLLGPDYARLALLVVVAIGVHAWLVSKTAVPARDSLGYARLALSIETPGAAVDRYAPPRAEPLQSIDIIREAEQPPGYPLAILATDRLLRCICTLDTPERSLLATQLANAIAAVLLVVPMYLTGRMLFSRNVGFAAALLFQVLPVPARVTSDGLSEGVYLLNASVAIMLGVRALKKPGIGTFLLCGLATGATYLVRPEGLLIAVGTGAVVVGAALSRNWPRDVALGRLTALCVGVSLVAVPYMVLIGALSKKPTFDSLVNPGKEGPDRLWLGQPGAHAPGAATPLFAAWWDPKTDAGKSRTLWAVGAVWGECVKAVHYIVGTLALFSFFAHRKRFLSGDCALWLLLALYLLTFLLLVYLAAMVGYVSERHTVLFVMLVCLLGASGIEPLVEAVAHLPRLGRIIAWPQAAPGTFLLMLVATALPYTLKPMHPQREGHKHAGLWLAGRVSEGDWVKDPLAWAEWYAGRTQYRSTTFHGQPEYIWVVWEKGKSPHSRLPLWEEANQLVKGREPAYRWPADAPPDGPVVEVYKVKFSDVYKP